MIYVRRDAYPHRAGRLLRLLAAVRRARRGRRQRGHCHHGRPGASGERRLRVSEGLGCASAPPRRLTHPRSPEARRSAGSGEWQETTWDEALDEIASTISGLCDEFGPEALAYGFGTLHGADWGLGERFMNLFGSPNAVGQDKVCSGPNALGECLTYGFGPRSRPPRLRGRPAASWCGASGPARRCRCCGDRSCGRVARAPN